MLDDGTGRRFQATGNMAEPRCDNCARRIQMVVGAHQDGAMKRVASGSDGSGLSDPGRRHARRRAARGDNPLASPSLSCRRAAVALWSRRASPFEQRSRQIVATTGNAADSWVQIPLAPRERPGRVIDGALNRVGWMEGPAHQKSQEVPGFLSIGLGFTRLVDGALQGISLDREEALFIGSCHRCGAVRDRQFVVDVDQMGLHGRLADVETFGDLGVGVAVGDFPQHIDLS